MKFISIILIIILLIPKSFVYAVTEDEHLIYQLINQYGSIEPIPDIECVKLKVANSYYYLPANIFDEYFISRPNEGSFNDALGSFVAYHMGFVGIEDVISEVNKFIVGGGGSTPEFRPGIEPLKEKLFEYAKETALSASKTPISFTENQKGEVSMTIPDQFVDKVVEKIKAYLDEKEQDKGWSNYNKTGGYSKCMSIFTDPAKYSSLHFYTDAYTALQKYVIGKDIFIVEYYWKGSGAPKTYSYTFYELIAPIFHLYKWDTYLNAVDDNWLRAYTFKELPFTLTFNEYKTNGQFSSPVTPSPDTDKIYDYYYYKQYEYTCVGTNKIHKVYDSFDSLKCDIVPFKNHDYYTTNNFINYDYSTDNSVTVKIDKYYETDWTAIQKGIYDEVNKAVSDSMLENGGYITQDGIDSILSGYIESLKDAIEEGTGDITGEEIKSRTEIIKQLKEIKGKQDVSEGIQNNILKTLNEILTSINELDFGKPSPMPDPDSPDPGTPSDPAYEDSFLYRGVNDIIGAINSLYIDLRTLSNENLRALTDSISGGNTLADIYNLLSGAFDDRSLDDLYVLLGNIYGEVGAIKGYVRFEVVTNAVDKIVSAFLGEDTLISAVVSAFSPLGETMKSRFPFSIPWDLEILIGSLAHKPVAPVFEMPFNLPLFGIHEVIVFDFGKYKMLSDISRSILSLIFLCGLIKLTLKISQSFK